MEYLKIIGETKLNGEVKISGAKKCSTTTYCSNYFSKKMKSLYVICQM